MSNACSYCGRLNRPGARYCASCQVPLDLTAAQLQPGQFLDGGAYRVVRPLGRGGMGAVWLVAQTKAFDRLAVVKEVVEYFDGADAGEQQRAQERFEAEARTLADLKHPGIPDLYAFFSEGGHNYLVMEYVEGPDLDRGLTREDPDTGRLVDGGPLPAEQVLRYMAQICEVLEYLAGRQPPVVHNDIKPGNIIVDRHSGRAVLVDFGTARTRYWRAGGPPTGGKESLYGTVGYAAPELYRGQAEPRSDVYSLAATAYHLLTDDDPRDHPFQYPHLDALPTALGEILRSGLAHEIGERPDAAGFRQKLAGYLGGQSVARAALAFPDGSTAGNRAELLALVMKQRRHAAGLLQDGTLARWLRDAARDEAAAQAAEEAVRRWRGNPDGALDDFIRQLGPAIELPGRLALRTASVTLPELGPGERARAEIQIGNEGQGYLSGEVYSSQSWVQLGRGTFACPPGAVERVPVEINTDGLAVDQNHVAAVTVTPDGGVPEVIPVQVRVIAPAIRVAPPDVDFGSVSRRFPHTSRRRFTVTNVGRVVAQCRVEGAPDWLVVNPVVFPLTPGARQDVELVGRLDKLPSRRHELDLMVAPAGGAVQPVQVTLRVRGGLLD